MSERTQVTQTSGASRGDAPMSQTVAPYGLDSPQWYHENAHYEDFTANLAGRLVERNDGLDVLLDVLARHCDSEYGLDNDSTSLMAHVEHYVEGNADIEDWVVEHTYSDLGRADMALYADVRYCEMAEQPEVVA